MVVCFAVIIVIVCCAGKELRKSEGLPLAGDRGVMEVAKSKRREAQSCLRWKRLRQRARSAERSVVSAQTRKAKVKNRQRQQLIVLAAI
jgi:hypothetical protein